MNQGEGGDSLDLLLEGTLLLLSTSRGPESASLSGIEGVDSRRASPVSIPESG